MIDFKVAAVILPTLLPSLRRAADRGRLRATELRGLYKGYKCGSGCRKGQSQEMRDERTGQRRRRYHLQIVRFAPYGRIPIAGAAGIDWLIVMEDGAGLRGELEVELDPDGEEIYPGRLRLGGKMQIFLQVPLLGQIEIVSDDEPVLTGQAPGWPPWGMEISLANGPIRYYRKGAEGRVRGAPVLEVVANTSTLASEPSRFLSVTPRIVSAAPVDAEGRPAVGRPAAGVMITWQDTRPLVDVDLSGYRVYRNDDIGDLAGWRLVGSVASDQTSFLDRGLHLDRDVEYLIVHTTTLLPFDYEYEGTFGAPHALRARAAP